MAKASEKFPLRIFRLHTPPYRPSRVEGWRRTQLSGRLVIACAAHPSLGAHTVELENVLNQIDANCRNLHDERSFRIEWLMSLTATLQQC